MQTINEEKQKLSAMFSYNEYLKAAFTDGFNKGVEFVRRWISVDEELPEPESRVLLKSTTGYIEIRTISKGYINDGKLTISIGGNKVAEWRPIELK